MGYTLDRFVKDLREITGETRDPREITSRLRPLVHALAVTPTWLAPQHAEPDINQGSGIHVLHEEPDHSLMVFVAAWASHRGVAPHNHGTWAVVMMLPDSIHSVQNDSDDVTVSLHVYGFNLNLTRRSQFDPERELEEPVTLTMSRD